MKVRPNGTVEYSATLVKWRQNVSETVLRQLGATAGPKGPVVPWEPVADGTPVVVAGYVALAGDPTSGEFGDVDKITRALLDGLADAQVYANDRQVIFAPILKRACRSGELEHVHLEVTW